MPEGLSQLFAPDRPFGDILRDLLDILIVTFLLYRALLVLKGTRAMQMGIGILAFGVLYVVAKSAQLTTVLVLLERLASAAILIIVVVFQNDIRRALIRLGAKAWMTRGRDAQERVIDEVVGAATELARHRMGALICLERDANVLEFVKSEGIAVDSEVTRELLVSLFVPEAVNKTHDGAVLIRDLRIARAGIFLPMPEVTKVADPSLGSRHRAAIGITEETDAIVVVVSEERGTVTLCFPNGMVQNIDAASLRQVLLTMFGRTPRREEPGFVRRMGMRLGRGHAPTAPPSRAPERQPPPSKKPPQPARAPGPPPSPAERPELTPPAARTAPPPPRAAIERPHPVVPRQDEEDHEELPASQVGVSVPMEKADLPEDLDEDESNDSDSDSETQPVPRSAVQASAPDAETAAQEDS